jgi:3,4-dihydroxy 2-butanone 4-phosphate synthase/GTP cyclohydrolase II
VLVRTGQTEGGVDLCRLAGLQPAAAIIEVMNPDGTMARLPELRQFCDQHQIKLCSVASIIAHRLSREQLVERVDEVPFETSGGSFRLLVYRSAVDALPHVVLCKGRVGREPIDEPVLVRVHSQNLLGDVFDDATDPSGRRLAAAMRKINEAGEGAVVYLRTEGSGSGLLQRLQTLHDREGGGEDAEAERAAVRRAAGMFDYGIGSQILRDLGVRRLRLMTDHPMQLHALQGFELELTEFIPLIDRPAD